MPLKREKVNDFVEKLAAQKINLLSTTHFVQYTILFYCYRLTLFLDDIAFSMLSHIYTVCVINFFFQLLV